MKKGFAAALLALLLLAAGLPVSADAVYRELTYETNGGTITFGVESGGEYLSVKSAEGLVGDVVLPARLEGISLRRISTELPCQGEGCIIGGYIPPAEGFRGCGQMTSLTIPGTVESVWAENGSPFEGCAGLKKVVIEKGSLKCLGKDSFSDCPLESITVPSTVEEIDPRFTDSEKLRELALAPDNPRFSVDSRGFLYNRDKTKLLSGLAVRDLGTGLALPDSVTEIGPYAFRSRTELTELNLPERVKKLGEGAFSGCASLQKLTLPSGITDYPSYAFSDCTALEQLVLPEGVTVVRTGAFQRCTALSDVRLPATLTHLVDSCFDGCAALREIKLPPNLQRLDNNVFSHTGLLELTVPGTVKRVEQFALYGCENLKQVTVQEGVEVLEWCAFSNCPSLEKAYLPESLREIYDYQEPEMRESYPWVFDGASKAFAIYAKEDSFAHRYALKTGISFVSTGLVNAPFTDIRGHWAEDAVDWAFRKQVVFGTSPTLFEPEKEITRAMFAAILARYDGDELPLYDNSFADCDSAAYYYPAVTWLQERGIVLGTSPTAFSPHRNLSREELASMLYRYVRHLGLDTAAEETLEAYQDADMVHGWALEPVRWAVEAGILQGRAETELNPRGTATRAECTAMLQRLDTLLAAAGKS